MTRDSRSMIHEVIGWGGLAVVLGAGALAYLGLIPTLWAALVVLVAVAATLEPETAPRGRGGR